MTDRRRYPTDLSDREWELIASLVPAPKPGGRPPVHERREIVNAMAYWVRAGCAWRGAVALCGSRTWLALPGY